MFLTFNNKRDFAPRFAIMAMALGGLGGLPGYDDLKEVARLWVGGFLGRILVLIERLGA